MASKKSWFNVDANAFEGYNRRVNLNVKMGFTVLISDHFRERKILCIRGVRSVRRYLKGFSLDRRGRSRYYIGHLPGTQEMRQLGL